MRAECGIRNAECGMVARYRARDAQLKHGFHGADGWRARCRARNAEFGMLNAECRGSVSAPLHNKSARSALIARPNPPPCSSASSDGFLLLGGVFAVQV